MALNLRGAVVNDLSRGGMTPVILLNLQSLQGKTFFKVHTLVDTGFAGSLVINHHIVMALGLAAHESSIEDVTLADGRRHECRSWSILILLEEGQKIPVQALYLPGRDDIGVDGEAILGTEAMKGNKLTLWALPGEAIRIGAD